MENDLTNSTVLNGIKEDNCLLGNVPKTVEVSVIGICMGATTQFEIDGMTGLTNVCMLHPKQPAVVTLGNENSIGPLNYEGFYRQLGLDGLIIKDNTTTISNKKVCEIVLGEFCKTFNCGNGNGNLAIQVERLNKNFYDLGKHLKSIYPQCYRTFEDFRDEYLEELNARFSRNSSKALSENTEEKKTIIPQEQVQLAASNANA